LQKIGVGFSFFQYSITPTLHKYAEQYAVDAESSAEKAKERLSRRLER
jgi:hypothetical protein